jgi:hypothetical protein
MQTQIDSMKNAKIKHSVLNSQLKEENRHLKAQIKIYKEMID